METYFCKHCLAELPQGATDYNYDTANLDYECSECGECGISPFHKSDLKTIEFEGTTFTLSEDDANDAYHLGDCMDECKALVKKDYIRSQLDNLSTKEMTKWMESWNVPYVGEREEIELYFIWMVAEKIANFK